MARITVEDCLDHVDNRFELVMVASKRARQIATGGKEPMLPEDGDKPTVIALREIENGLVTDDVLHEVDLGSIEYGEEADETATDAAGNTAEGESDAEASGNTAQDDQSAALISALGNLGNSDSDPAL